MGGGLRQSGRGFTNSHHRNPPSTNPGSVTEYIILEGDAKLYKVLQSLKFEYGECFKWLIPFPRDWHMLMNYQHALIKPYLDAGVKELAKVTGYPIAAIMSCGQFKRTHYFYYGSMGSCL